MYGYPVTAPITLGFDAYSSPYVPKEPDIKELPGIVDAGTEGIRLQGTQAKAKPRMTKVGQANNRKREAEELANSMRRAYAVTRAWRKQEQAKSRQSEKMTDDYARKLGRR